MTDSTFKITSYASDVPPDFIRVEAIGGLCPGIIGVGLTEDDAADDWRRKARAAHLFTTFDDHIPLH